jgi:rRNA maturation endonuclease Nob1
MWKLLTAIPVRCTHCGCIYDGRLGNFPEPLCPICVSEIERKVVVQKDPKFN